MNADTPPCPHCTSARTIKNGHIHNGKQNHKCKGCGRQFVEDPQNKVISQETKELIDKLLLELDATEHTTVSAAERQNNLIEQSHRPTRDQERQQRGFRIPPRAQGFLFTHAEVNHLFRYTRARTPAWLRRRNLICGFGLWDDLALSIA